jgi:hypothetical protein
MTALTQAITYALFHFLWQGTLVALLLWAGLFVSRKASPNVRYLLSCAAMILLFLLPVFTVGRAYEFPGATPAPARAESPESMSGIFGGLVYSESEARGSWLTAASDWAITAWACGVLILSFRMAWGAGRLCVLRRQAVPASESIRTMVSRLSARIGVRNVQIFTSSIADVPSAIGWIRPLILLPATAITGLSPAQLEAVVAHELAHIRRHDYLVNLLQMIVEALLFYHPAVWWVSGRIRHERELCCDDLAVRSCGDALCYARALATLEKLRGLKPDLAMASTGGPLLYRIQRLVMQEAQTIHRRAPRQSWLYSRLGSSAWR